MSHYSEASRLPRARWAEEVGFKSTVIAHPKITRADGSLET